MIRYIANMSKSKMFLWCYMIWYCVTVIFHLDLSWRIWLNSVGISLVIGIALMLSVANTNMKNVDYWQTFRLFLIPFCVSSFSALIKDKEFILFVPPKTHEQVTSVSACIAFVVFVVMVKWYNSGKPHHHTQRFNAGRKRR